MEQQGTFSGYVNQPTPLTKIHPRIITLDQLGAQICRGCYRRESIILPKRVRDEKPVVLRHGLVPARAVHRDVQRRVNRNICYWVTVELLQPRGRGEV